MDTNPVHPAPTEAIIRSGLTPAEQLGPEQFTLISPDLTVTPGVSLVDAAQRIQALRAGRAVSVRPAHAVIGDSGEFETFNIFFAGEADWTVALSLPHARQADLFSALRAAASLKAAA